MREYGKRSNEELSSSELVNLIKQEAESQKCFNINVVDIRDKSSMCSYFLVAEVFVQSHLNSARDHLFTFLKKLSVIPHVEGKTSWVLIDCDDVVIHLMLPETRSHYSLDELWANCPKSEEIEV